MDDTILQEETAISLNDPILQGPIKKTERYSPRVSHLTRDANKEARAKRLGVYINQYSQQGHITYDRRMETMAQDIQRR